MFYFNPDLAQNDLMEEGDEAFDSYAREEEEEEEGIQYRDIELESLQKEASEVDGTGTIAPQDRFKNEKSIANGTTKSSGKQITRIIFLPESMFIIDCINLIFIFKT